MTQNIYDDEEFFAGYSRLRRSVEGLDGAPEWPALRALLPNLSGLKVLDLGCGFGWFCRWARQQGAARVLGIDVSERMLLIDGNELGTEAQADKRVGETSAAFDQDHDCPTSDGGPASRFGCRKPLARWTIRRRVPILRACPGTSRRSCSSAQPSRPQAARGRRPRPTCRRC